MLNLFKRTTIATALALTSPLAISSSFDITFDPEIFDNLNRPDISLSLQSLAETSLALTASTEESISLATNFLGTSSKLLQKINDAVGYISTVNTIIEVFNASTVADINSVFSLAGTSNIQTFIDNTRATIKDLKTNFKVIPENSDLLSIALSLLSSKTAHDELVEVYNDTIKYAESAKSLSQSLEERIEEVEASGKALGDAAYRVDKLKDVIMDICSLVPIPQCWPTIYSLIATSGELTLLANQVDGLTVPLNEFKTEVDNAISTAQSNIEYYKPLVESPIATATYTFSADPVIDTVIGGEIRLIPFTFTEEGVNPMYNFSIGFMKLSTIGDGDFTAFNSSGIFCVTATRSVQLPPIVQLFQDPIVSSGTACVPYEWSVEVEQLPSIIGGTWVHYLTDKILFPKTEKSYDLDFFDNRGSFLDRAYNGYPDTYGYSPAYLYQITGKIASPFEITDIIPIDEQLSPVDEPSSISILAMGLIGLGLSFAKFQRKTK